MLDDNRKMRSTPGHDGVMETPLGSPLVEVKDVVVVVNRSDIKTNSSSGVGIPSFLPGGGGGNKNKGSVSSNIKAPDYPPSKCKIFQNKLEKTKRGLLFYFRLREFGYMIAPRDRTKT